MQHVARFIGVAGVILWSVIAGLSLYLAVYDEYVVIDWPMFIFDIIAICLLITYLISNLER